MESVATKAILKGHLQSCTEHSLTDNSWQILQHSKVLLILYLRFILFDFKVSWISRAALPRRTSDFNVWWLQTRKFNLLTGVTILKRKSWALYKGICWQGKRVNLAIYFNCHLKLFKNKEIMVVTSNHF